MELHQLVEWPEIWSSQNGGLMFAPFSDEVRGWANDQTMEELFMLTHGHQEGLLEEEKADEAWLDLIPTELRYTIGSCPMILADAPVLLVLSPKKERQYIESMLYRIMAVKLEGRPL